MNLERQATSGIAWSIVGQGARQALTFLSTFLLARLLLPDAFGLLGMVTVFTGFVVVFEDLGLGPAIVQAKELKQEQLSTIFWLNLGFSFFLALFLAALSPLVASFYAEDSLAMILCVLAVKFPFGAFATVPQALLLKRMAFKHISIVDSLVVLLSASVAVILAYRGFGVWALVLQQLSVSIFRALLYWIVSPWKPGWAFRYREVKEQLNFGVNLQAGSMLNYGSRSVDDLLIGKFVGAGPLGVYQMAYRLMIWPLQNVSHVVGKVMFPALASIQDDRPRVKRAFLRVVSAIALITFPLMMGSWIVAPEAITLLLGDNWAGAIPIFRVLALLGLVQSITVNTGWIFLSQGRTDIRFRLTAVFSLLFTTSFVLGLRWGAFGVAVAYTLASLLVTPVQLHIAGRLIDMRVTDVAKSLRAIFASALFMASIVWLVNQLLPSIVPAALALLIQIGIGVLTYGATIHFFQVPAYVDLGGMLLEQVHARFPASKKILTPNSITARASTNDS